MSSHTKFIHKLHRSIHKSPCLTVTICFTTATNWQLMSINYLYPFETLNMTHSSVPKVHRNLSKLSATRHQMQPECSVWTIAARYHCNRSGMKSECYEFHIIILIKRTVVYTWPQKTLFDYADSGFLLQ